ncbi:hypothetical protein SASPL_121551 [Salvia splendens]|uniref:Uncharacterized protein n=1 Tax=Salvia splendens TaxID=180675 RepID=A0A8X8XSQ1_SALSN|nr:uncharacterized protein LOC121811017 [Salvia splendens]KAG6419333.1 hypothetical protein SASPL_121551 [Salvia splendens]
METPSIIETQSKGAEIYQGEACKENLGKLLEEFSVPKGVFRVGEIEEVGLNRSTGFFWLKQKEKTEHYFPGLGSMIYDSQITSSIDQSHLKNITGLQAKQFFITATVSDVHVGVTSDDTVKFTTTLGLSRDQPISAFKPEDENKSI